MVHVVSLTRPDTANDSNIVLSDGTRLMFYDSKLHVTISLRPIFCLSASIYVVAPLLG